MPDRLERHPDERLLRARAEQQMPDDAEARRSLPAGLERVFDYCVENNARGGEGGRQRARSGRPHTFLVT